MEKASSDPGLRKSESLEQLSGNLEHATLDRSKEIEDLTVRLELICHCCPLNRIARSLVNSNEAEHPTSFKKIRAKRKKSISLIGYVQLN